MKRGEDEEKQQHTENLDNGTFGKLNAKISRAKLGRKILRRTSSTRQGTGWSKEIQK